MPMKKSKPIVMCYACTKRKVPVSKQRKDRSIPQWCTQCDRDPRRPVGGNKNGQSIYNDIGLEGRRKWVYLSKTEQQPFCEKAQMYFKDKGCGHDGRSTLFEEHCQLWCRIREIKSAEDIPIKNTKEWDKLNPLDIIDFGVLESSVKVFGVMLLCRFQCLKEEWVKICQGPNGAALPNFEHSYPGINKWLSEYCVEL